MRIRLAIAFASVALGAFAAEPKPSAEEQARVLEAARKAALDYTRTLPDFLCTEIIERFSDATGKGKYWSAVDSLMVLLTYFGRQERYQLLEVNHAPPSGSYDSLPGATSQGEFGTMLRRIFEPSCAAEFEWRSRAEVRGKQVWAYAYRVLRANSTLSLAYRNGGESSEMAAGYHGLVDIDAGAGTAVRLTLEADDIRDFEVSFASTTLEYDYADVGGRPYLLPLKAETQMRTGEVMTRNVVDFQSYRKFDVNTDVQYPRADQPKDHF
jgi:hypothetical protein